MDQPVKVAFNGIRNIRVSGWELWPTRKSLDGKTWLCRWCAKPLDGSKTSYCSSDCANEIYIRATIPGVREFAIKRANGICEGCGINLKDLEIAFEWYRKWFGSLQITTWKREPNAWPVTPEQFREAAEYKSYGHLWEVNHKVAIAEGGDPTCPTNLEVLCLRCHRKHTKGVISRIRKRKLSP